MFSRSLAVQSAAISSSCRIHTPLKQHRRVQLIYKTRQWRCYDSPQSDQPSQPTSGGDRLAELDLNQLQTALNAAIASENYELASKIRDVLAIILGPDHIDEPADWQHLGTLDWLAERAETLGFRFPTEVQRRSTPVIIDEDDCFIESETGSGKTLAFLLPALSLLDYPPIMYPDDLKGPQLVIIVPTRELGVQIAMLTYKLFGGSTNPGIPGERANMFHYTGPRGLKVRGLLLLDEVDSAIHDRYLASTHVVVGTPKFMAKALAGGVPVLQHSKVIVVDEVDACIKEEPESMEAIMNAACFNRAQTQGTQQYQQQMTEENPSSVLPSMPSSSSRKPVVIIAGASLDDSTVEHSVEAGWLKDPVRVVVGARMRVPKGLTHKYIVVEEGDRLGVMTRHVRADLKLQNPDEPPPRVMVFAGSETQARAMADPLRTVLWGEHSISVLLPEGSEPIKALHSFRDNQTTLLLATPAAARGLDLPAVSHVYNVAPPVDAADYLHRAGRAGRIGALSPGIVTTMVTEAELPHLLQVAQSLGVSLVKQEQLPVVGLTLYQDGEVDVDALKKALEDIYKLK